MLIGASSASSQGRRYDIGWYGRVETQWMRDASEGRSLEWLKILVC